MNNTNKIILDLCGATGAWSNPYKEAGYTVYNITLPDYDVRTYKPPENVYGILAAPPCTEFSFAKSNSKYPRNIRKGMEVVIACLKIIWEVQYNLPTPLAKRTNLKFWALENPNGMLKWFLGKPALIFNPFDYGDRYQKTTCLWGCFKEPNKNPVKLRDDEKVKFDQRLNISLPDLPINYSRPQDFDRRAARRSITPPGFAKAFFKANR